MMYEPCSSLRSPGEILCGSSFIQLGKSVSNQFRPSVQTRRYPPVSPLIQRIDRSIVGISLGAFAVPGDVLAEVAVGFGAVVAEALKHIEADFFALLEFLDGGHPIVEVRDHVDPRARRP